MNVAPGKHPAREVLQAFGLGKLDDASITQVSRHLETCVDCKRQVAELSGDSLLDKLRQGNGPAGTPAPGQTLAPLASGKQPASPPPNSVPPELLNNTQYEIVRELGAGGMGVVYLARNKLMDRLEVLKVISTAMVHKEGALDRFLREIRAAAALSHDNVVKAYTALQLGELLVFAMEYVEGDDLAKVVKTHGPLAVANACYYARQVALGLQHAHDKNMVHRDIKPHNLILARVGKKHMVKILDFGLAKAASEKKMERDLTGEGKMLGTPDYMAPEQILDAASADIRADIYSLGCTLYYLLTGSPPFDANSLFELLQAHQTKDSRLLNLVRPEVPVELAAVVAKMMAKDPRKRYQKPAEVAQALNPFFMKPGPKGPGAPPSVSVGETDKVAPRRAEGSTKRSETVAPQPPETLAPTAQAAANPFAFAPELLVQNPLPKKGNVEAKVRRRLNPLHLGLAVAVGVVFLGLVVWGISLRVTTPDGTIVLENLPADAEVKVDGVVVTITLADGKTFEVRGVTAKKKHWLEVTHQGVKVLGQEVEVDAGGRKSIDVRWVQKEILAKTETPPSPRNPDRRAAEWALSLGGNVLVNVAGEEKKIDAVEKLPAAGFELVQVDLSNKPVSDGALVHLKGLTNLRALSLAQTGVSDAGLAHLEGLTKLAYLNLWVNPKVTDAGLKYLKGLRNLNYLELTGANVSDAGMVYLRGLTDLSTLNLCQTRITDGGLAHLEGLSKLVFLSLSGNPKVSDAGMVHLKGLTNLDILYLAGTKVSDDGLAHIKGLINLRRLALEGTKVSDAGLAHLKGLTNLETFGISDTNTSDAGLAHIKDMTNLTALWLSNTNVSNAGLGHLKDLTKLRELLLHDTMIGDDGLRALYGLFRLRELNLTHTKVTAAGIAALRKQLPDCNIRSGAAGADSNAERRAAEWVRSLGGNVLVKVAGEEKKIDAAEKLPAGDFELVRIDLVNKPVSDAALVHLKGLTNLTTLGLDGTNVSDAGLIHLKGLTNLTILGLDGTKVSDAGLAQIKDLINLTGLGLTGSKCNDAGLAHIKGLTNLKDLWLGRSKFSDLGLVHIKDLTNLERLGLWDTNVSDAGLVHLKDLTKLRELGLDHTKVSGAGMVHLQGLSKLERLFLVDTKVTDAGLVHLKRLANLKDLNLGGTGVSDAGLAHLEGLNKLVFLSFWGNPKVSDAGMVHLKGLTNLEHLSLAFTNISDAGLPHLKDMTKLTMLGLNNTNVSNAGLVILKGLTSLRELFLQDTKVGDDGLRALYDLFRLRELNLTNTKVTAAGIAALKKAIPDCHIIGLAGAGLPTPPAGDGFVPLFNAKDLAGWKGLRDQFWSVKNGAIVGSTPRNGINFNTFLCSTKKFKDFELQFQVKLSKSGNSGVQIRSKIVDEIKFVVHGPQCDMGAQYWGSLWGEGFNPDSGFAGGGGMMKGADAKLIKEVLKVEEFNDYYVKCVGKHVTIKLNGKTTVDDDFPIMPDEGIIAWQIHPGPPMEVVFRNVEIKELPPPDNVPSMPPTPKELSLPIEAKPKDTVADLIKALSDPNQEARTKAAFTLGAIGTNAEPAVGALVQIIADSLEKTETRVEAAMALKGIGPVPAAVQAVPTLLKVLQDPGQDGMVRARVVWSLRVHAGNLRTLPGIYPTFTKILSEARTDSNKTLRYDCAYMLSILQGPKAPAKALDILLEYLKDDKILIFKNEKVVGADIVETGKGDGRLMAIQALTEIGATRVKQRRDIIQQLQKLANNEATPVEMRDGCKKLLASLNLGASEFKSLFNGKDGSGWKIHPAQPGNWRVVNGILTGSGPVSHLYTNRDDYKNFHLRLDVRNGASTGVYFRTSFGPAQPANNPMWLIGYNAKVDNNRLGGLIVDDGC